MTDLAPIAALYRRFAVVEARGRSPLYETLANAIAEDSKILAFLATLPEPKRHPPLLLGAVRAIAGLATTPDDFRARLLAHAPAIHALMLVRRTQTNEPARCACLLPVLASLPQPLALIEVGASAGLNLFPDLYGYDYGAGRIIPPPTPGAPIFPCALTGPVPIPQRAPTIAWRAGLDLDPVDLADPDRAAWLQTLVWPGNQPRAERLAAAIALVRPRQPRIIQADLRTGLPALAAEAPKDATLVVMHTAVLGYIQSTGERAAFATQVAGLGARWLANEAPAFLPTANRPPSVVGRFLMALDGQPLAWTDPHGASLAWIA